MLEAQLCMSRTVTMRTDFQESEINTPLSKAMARTLRNMRQRRASMPEVIRPLVLRAGL